MILKNNKTKVCFLFDKTNNWIKKFISSQNFNYKNKYLISYCDNLKLLKPTDILVILGFTKILKKKILRKNQLNIVVHPSNLPRDKGFAPIANQVLQNKKRLYISLIQASDKVDEGDIILKKSFNLNGHELSDELRNIQANQTIKILKKFFKIFPNLKFIKQKGKGNFNRRRYPKDSELNIYKSIKSQFNLLRICDNDNYPAFFKYKKIKYLIKIYKS